MVSFWPQVVEQRPLWHASPSPQVVPHAPQL
jgi:hypothetical protein